jgi:hypothetical protein
MSVLPEGRLGDQEDFFRPLPCLAVLFLAADFFTADFLAAPFFAGLFFATAFLAGLFLAGLFLLDVFFFDDDLPRAVVFFFFDPKALSQLAAYFSELPVRKIVIVDLLVAEGN